MSSGLGDVGNNGGIPDLFDSPDVLTWMRILRGVGRSAGRFLLSAVAALIEFTVCTAYRLGMARDIALNLSKYTGENNSQARVFALFDCKVPMKCHLMSVGS